MDQIGESIEKVDTLSYINLYFNNSNVASLKGLKYML